ncbi:S-phase kinase-associated protein 2 [Cyprinodon tularosa]|uniref:S-phase kinase-associated protein 2 n=1 Tax=Cyprinodon tularosa TaxID=77115 RepID=UPI0018E24244|nr:S-phase kinase-associated protein 2 [Cyprinodon tularosa]
MSEASCPLQELPCLNVQNPPRSKRKSWLSGGLGSESTPTELLLQRSPRPKHPRLLSRGKENDFVLARRSRRRKQSSSGVSWDHLPDELLLRIYFCLPLQDLLRVSAVCKRWNRLAFDESLWHSVDLEGLTHTGPALQRVLKTGVRRLRCPRAFVEELEFTETGPLRLVELDLSSSIMPTSALQSIICGCRQLQYLSLEALQLSDSIISCLAKNCNLLQLNLSGCSGFSAAALADMLGSCCSLEQVNVSWCNFSREHVQSVVNHLSPSVTALNLSGYRESLTLDDVKVLVERCPDIQTLDLSDSTLLMADSFPVLKQLKNLRHLSLSRCYHIHLAALSDLGKMLPSLSFLDVFSFVQDSQLAALKKDMPHVSINSRPFSSVARPTPASRIGASQLDQTMWNRQCRLRVRL